MEKNKSKITNKLKLKDIYSNNKNRRYNEIVSIVSERATLISNPKEVILKNKYKIIIVSVIIIALLLSTMYNDIITFFITLAFLAGICLIVSVFNAFKLICNKDGLNISFGFQKVFFPYDKIKCIYLSKYDDYSFLRIAKDYNIVIKYADNNGFIKELSFSTLFVTPKEINDFLNNFIIEDKNSVQEVNFERFKLIKKILKILLFVAVLAAIIAFYFIG